jgi:hypothetical protein
MAKARTSRLKVFRTPIGFHDAYVAAPSQKAALEAWGSESNLFASGAAEQVSGAALTKVPLSRPGEVIKVLRGSKAEQVAALGEVAIRKKETGSIKSGATKAEKKPKPEKPSREALDEAEEQVETLRRAQAKELGEIDAEIAQLERRRRELQRQQGRELGELEEKAERERARYERQMDAWRENN